MMIQEDFELELSKNYVRGKVSDILENWVLGSIYFPS